MDREFKDVRDFHLKFNQIAADQPGHLTRRKLAERANFLLEELREFAQGAGLILLYNLETGLVSFVVDEHGSQDLALQADSLIDLVYVAKGTAVMLGLPWQPLWDDVQRANMAKTLGLTHRGYLMDVKKPEGWQPPNTSEILYLAGYREADFSTKRPDLADEEVTIIDDDKCREDECHR
jgi:predicted HAD superfamily Cof-like phosphohydrolase